MKKVTALYVIVSFLLVSVSPAVADDSDIFGKDIQSNVLILFDTSSSMGADIPSLPYDPNTTYPGTWKKTVVYQQKKPKDPPTIYKNTIAEVQDANARAALAADGFWGGKIGGSSVALRMGNYINFWECQSCSGLEKKIDAAKRVVTDVIRNTEGVRFGVMRLRSSPNNHGEIVAPIGTDKTTLINAVNAMQIESGTPLGEQLYDAGQYFQGKTLINGTTFPSPIQYECQPNFVIMFTDGAQDGNIKVEDEAKKRFAMDHASWLTGKQNVIVDTVAFGLAGISSAIDTLKKTAENGGGSFYQADNASQLMISLQGSLNKVLAATYTFASPVIPTTSTSGSTRAYVASFKSDLVRPFWTGFLKAYQRDANGLVPVDANGVPLASAMVWDAGERLSQILPQNRLILTSVGGSPLQYFVKTNAAITPALLGVSTSAERDQIIDFIRGIDALDEDLDLDVTEARAWKLGDIFHSSPVLLSHPIAAVADPSYDAYKQAMSSRPTILITGANDGMLHAFNESDGMELWAFIPPDLLSTLKELTARSAPHPYYVDSSPIAADIKVGGAWKTIVVFGERRGGKYYHALEIDVFANPRYLWSFTDSKIAETWSEPALGKIKMDDGTEKFVAFVGGGYDTAQNNNAGKALFVIDLATGQKLWEYYNDGSLDDRQYMNFSLVTSPTIADLNHDGYIDRVYIGDVGGQLWKFDLSAPATLTGGLVDNWTGKRLFAADPSQANPPAVGEYYPQQAIYAAPALAFDSLGSLWVYFGMGDLNHPNNTSTNRFYGIKDNTTMTNGSTLTESSLMDVTSGNKTATQGWFFKLGADEKVFGAADVFNQIVFFSTFTPGQAVTCGSGGGEARLYAVQMETGYGGIQWASAEKEKETKKDWQNQRSIVVGSGIALKPIVVINYTGSTLTASVVTATTNEQLPSNPAPAPSSLKRLIYWHEVF